MSLAFFDAPHAEAIIAVDASVMMLIFVVQILRGPIAASALAYSPMALRVCHIFCFWCCFAAHERLLIVFD